MGGDVGINTYLATMNYRTGLHAASQQAQQNRTGSGTAEAVAAQNKLAPEAAKTEGKTDSSTRLPPPNDVGKLMDFKV